MDKNLIQVNATIYEQDCESYRYQDGLKWSRFQTAATIEGAVLLALTQLSFTQLELRVVMVFGFLTVLVLCIMSLKDETDAGSYEDRIKKFEQMGEPFIPRKWPHILRGAYLMRMSIALLNIFNLFMLINKWY